MASLQDGDKISTVEYEDSVNVNIEQAGGGPSHISSVDIKDGPASRNKKEMICTSCPIEMVTVFLDRAEVHRAAETPVEAGENEIVITGLPSVVDEDSVRVQCFGEATIIEVSYREEIIKETPENQINPDDCKNEIKTLQKEREELQKKIKQVKEKLEVLEKEKRFLITYGDRLRPSDKAGDKLAEAFDKKSLESVASFLEFFHGNCERLNQEMFSLTEESKKLNKDVELINERMEKLNPDGNLEEKSHVDRQVSILLEAENQTELKLVLSYVVSDAGWTPLYDFRAFSRESKLQLLYFGIIKQRTGEEWVDAKLSLSTAMPSVGGSPPDLDAWYIHPSRAIKHQKKKMSFRRSRRDSDELLACGYAGDLAFDVMPARASLALKAPARKQYFETEVTEGITSTSFEIARQSTIKCDDTGHKVSICQIELSPDFEYVTVPKLVAHAFLKASVKNTSNYALLAGPVNVFLDNNFLTKSYLEAVSPMEEFEVSLGADPAVKVTYKPLKKYKQTTGIMSKYTHTNYHQEIVIKNTKFTAVKITVTDGLPKSTDEKVKVNLIEPVIPVVKHKGEKVEESDKPIKLNDKNQVEWVLEIPPSETKQLNLKYNVEHPVSVGITGMS